MDTQDRYLNTKCTRYAFRAGRPKEAESKPEPVSKDEPAENPAESKPEEAAKPAEAPAVGESKSATIPSTSTTIEATA